MMMWQTWRWFGPDDEVSLMDVAQAGAQGVVTGLYDIRPGEIWPLEAINQRHKEINFYERSRSWPLRWDVVESLPISEAIRTAGKDRDAHIENWLISLKNLAKANSDQPGPKTICYNFMPVLDWTRTDLRHVRPNGARALRFDLVEFAAFDVFILRRSNAADDYDDEVMVKAEEVAAGFTEDAIETLTATILAGLPGSMESWSLETLRTQLRAYAGIDAETLKENLAYFLKAVIPEANALGMRLCAHPDDPPWPLFGLPRILSTQTDYEWLVNAVPDRANGITFCTGSLGARSDNDLPAMVKALGPNIHFVHLRNVHRESSAIPTSFFEDDHLEGSSDMVSIISALLAEQNRRKREGRADWQLPMRPDHGQEILDDQSRKTAPGYPAIGRMKGLAELRGVMKALEHNSAGTN